MEELDLGKEKIGKLLLKFSIPCVISMLVGALYNIVDQIFIGQGVGFLGNAATNVVYPFTVIALAIALLIGDGSSALLSLALGKKETKMANKTVGNNLVLSIIISVILVAVGFIFQDQILSMFGVTENSYQYAKDYMSVILLGIPFYIITTSLNGIIRADGAPKYAMIATLIGAVINIVLDPIAIFTFDMGVSGAALATIIGQLVSCIVTLAYFRNTKTFKLTLDSFKLQLSTVKRMCMLGISSFITQISMVIVIAVANNLITTFGAVSKYGADIPLSVFGIVMKVFGIIISVVVGVSVGSQPVAGYNYGANKMDRVKKTYKYILGINAVIGIIAMIAFQLFPQYIIQLFGSESGLYNEYAILCFKIYLGSILLCCMIKTTSIFMQSIGSSVKAMVLSISRDIIIFVPALILLANFFGVVGMLWAAVISDVLGFIFAMVLVATEFKKFKEHKHVKNTNEYESKPKELAENMIITINREYGSGGRYVGKILADKLGIKCYDEDLISLIAKESGFSEAYVEENEEAKNNIGGIGYNNDDKLFIAETKVIQDIVSEPCVIVGRCADYILKDNQQVLKVFLHASDENKVNRAVKYYNLSKEEAEKEIKRVNKARKKHYEYYTNQKWKDLSHYDVTMDVDKFGVEKTANNISKFMQRQPLEA